MVDNDLVPLSSHFDVFEAAFSYVRFINMLACIVAQLMSKYAFDTDQPLGIHVPIMWVSHFHHKHTVHRVLRLVCWNDKGCQSRSRHAHEALCNFSASWQHCTLVAGMLVPKLCLCAAGIMGCQSIFTKLIPRRTGNQHKESQKSRVDPRQTREFCEWC